MEAGRDYLVYSSKVTSNYIKGIQNDTCYRCGSTNLYKAPCEYCGTYCRYCLSCIALGKVSECCHILTVPNSKKCSDDVCYCWQGQLSLQQEKGSIAICKAIEQSHNLLVSAVTGAGKTEMLFNGIVLALRSGKRVCLASPRIDVILELAPRFQTILPNEDIAVLYGQQQDAYRYTRFVLATTHQLLKFTKAFDVLIVDEVDSFPFEGNMILQQRVFRAITESGVLIYLTATPTPQQKKLVRCGQFNQFELVARYHKHPLVVPEFVYIGSWEEDMKQKNKRAKWLKRLIQYVNGEKRCLVFLPRIDDLLVFEIWLHELGVEKFESVHASDPQRVEKVQAMRDGRIHFLLTTTILERGVTFKGIDVLIVGADHRNFSKAALIQIAGRVGRSFDCPTGRVLFLHNGISSAMKKARSFIEDMNKKAQKEGLLV